MATVPAGRLSPNSCRARATVKTVSAAFHGLPFLVLSDILSRVNRVVRTDVSMVFPAPQAPDFAGAESPHSPKTPCPKSPGCRIFAFRFLGDPSIPYWFLFVVLPAQSSCQKRFVRADYSLRSIRPRVFLSMTCAMLSFPAHCSQPFDRYAPVRYRASVAHTAFR